MSGRDLWVDYAKGIGIVLVVYGHVARGVHSAGLPIDEELYRLVDSVIYSFHMPLFFFLSGLFFAVSLHRQGAGGLVAVKLRTVALPYLVWSILQGLVEVLLSQYTNGHVTLAEVFSLLWQPRAQFWFLYVLFFMFLGATVIYRWLPARVHGIVAVLACLAAVFAEYLPGGMPLGIVIQYFPYFAVGVLFNTLDMSNLAVTGRRVVIALAAFVAMQYAVHMVGVGVGPVPPLAGNVLSLALAGVSILSVVALCRWLERFRLDMLARLGQASLAIYVMHILAGSSVRIILQKFLGIDSIAIHLVVGTLAGLGLPLLVLWLGNRFCLSGWLGLGKQPVVRSAHKLSSASTNH
jgi:fucose 4-O-acetylase-like acetyltransferase